MTPSGKLQLSSASLCDIGCRRKNNEDSVLCLPDRQVFCVADGMGGGEAGEVASAKVVEFIGEAFARAINEPSMTSDRKGQIICHAASDAGAWIWRHAAAQGMHSCGTTLVALAFDSVSGNAAVLHAGDSRAYLYREGRLFLLTRDHSFATAVGMKDEKLLPAGLQSIITRAVGIMEYVNLDLMNINAVERDVFLLCSDGLTRMLPDEAIEKKFNANSGAGTDRIARILVDAANKAGGHDNISVILVRVDSAGHPEGGKSASHDTSLTGSSADLQTTASITASAVTGVPPDEAVTARFPANPGRNRRSRVSAGIATGILIAAVIALILAFAFSAWRKKDLDAETAPAALRAHDAAVVEGESGSGEGGKHHGWIRRRQVGESAGEVIRTDAIAEKVEDAGAGDQ